MTDKPSDKDRVRAAMQHLKTARDALNAVKARRAASKVSEALNEAQGVLHAMQASERRAIRPAVRALRNGLLSVTHFRAERDPDT